MNLCPNQQPKFQAGDVVIRTTDPPEGSAHGTMHLGAVGIVMGASKNYAIIEDGYPLGGMLAVGVHNLEKLDG